MADQAQLPISDSVVDKMGLLTRPWEQFLRKLESILIYIKGEQSFALVNNQVSAADLTPLTFDRRFVSYAVVEYVAQRTTSSVVALAGGRLNILYNPDADSWSIANNVDVSVGTIGITYSITADGQVQYTTTNQAGTKVLSRIVFRVREINAKSSIYSILG